MAAGRLSLRLARRPGYPIPWLPTVLAPLTRSAGEHGPTSPGAIPREGVLAENVLAVAAGSWGVLMGLSPVLQIRRMLIERSSRDLSVGYFLILLVGFLLWICYGIVVRNPVLIVPNSIGFVAGAVTVIVALRLRPRRSCAR